MDYLVFNLILHSAILSKLQKCSLKPLIILYIYLPLFCISSALHNFAVYLCRTNSCVFRIPLYEVQRNFSFFQ
jgi:hypothetical protein